MYVWVCVHARTHAYVLCNWIANSYSPLDANGHQRHDGGVEWRILSVTQRHAEWNSETPASVHHELNEVRNAHEHSNKIAYSKVHNEQIGYRWSHLPISKNNINDEKVSDNPNSSDCKKEKGESNHLLQACCSFSCTVPYCNVYELCWIFHCNVSTISRPVTIERMQTWHRFYSSWLITFFMWADERKCRLDYSREHRLLTSCGARSFVLLTGAYLLFDFSPPRTSY